MSALKYLDYDVGNYDLLSEVCNMVKYTSDENKRRTLSNDKWNNNTFGSSLQWMGNPVSDKHFTDHWIDHRLPPK